MSDTAFAELFATSMARKGLTDQEAAATIGVSQPTVTRWRLGRNQPSDEMVQVLARFCGVNPSVLRRTLVKPIEPRRGTGEGSLGALLKQVEFDRGIEAAEAWKRFGIDKSAWYAWRADKRAPHLHEIPALAARLGVPEERLVLAVYRTEIRKRAR